MFESYPNRRGQSLCVIRVGCAQRPVPHGRAVPPLGCWRADRPAYGRHGAAALAPSLRSEDARASGGFIVVAAAAAAADAAARPLLLLLL